MLDLAIVWAVVTRPATLALLLLTGIVAWPLGRRRGVGGVTFVAVVGAILAATATTAHLAVSPAGIEPYLKEFLDPRYLVGGFGSTAEKWANIGLFLPLGAVGTLLWRRPATVVAGCALFSFVIEAWQGLIGRGGDAVDVVHNSVGAAAGVLLVVVSRSAAGAGR